MLLRQLRPEEVERAATMLARAFVGRPFTLLLADDEAGRFEASRLTFAALARYGLEYGEVVTTDALDAVAIWWAPEYLEVTDERAASTGLAEAAARLGSAAWARVETYDAVATEIHHRSIREPHWYLCVIGVAPEAQGRGLASRLLAQMFERLDRDQLPAYLDTNVSENVAFYEGRGFVVTTQAVEPASGILIRGMRRDPRPLAAGTGR